MRIVCNYVNKTRTSIEFLAINILRYVSLGLGIKSKTVRLKTFVEEWNGHNAFARPLVTRTASIVIFLCFYNELKFHILSREGKMLGIKISISSKPRHSIFVLSTIDMRVKMSEVTSHVRSDQQEHAQTSAGINLVSARGRRLLRSSSDRTCVVP